MRKFLIAFLIVPVAAFAISGVGGTTASGNTQSVTLTYSPTAGNPVIVAVPIAQNGTYPECQDNNLNTIFSGQRVTNGSLTLNVFYGFAAASFTAAKCNYFAASGIKGALEEFTGALGFNAFLTPSTTGGTGSNPSFTVTVDESTDVVACIFTAASGTFTAPTGLQTTTSPPSIIFTTTPVAGVATCSATLSGSVAWLGLPIELRVAASAPAITITQISSSHYPQGAVGCSRTSLDCEFGIATTGTERLVLLSADNIDANSGTNVSLDAIHNCAASPCGSANSLDTWTIPPSFHSTGTGSSTYTENSAGAHGPAVGTPGANYIHAHRTSAATNEPWVMVLVGIAGSTVIDGLNAQGETESTTHTITSVNVTGNDLVLQAIAGGANNQTPLPYVIMAGYSHFTFAYAYTNSGAAPVWTGSTTAPAAGSAIALTTQGTVQSSTMVMR